MNETMILERPVFLGFLLGVFFFGGLWWTVKRAIPSQRPGLWFSASLLVRTSIAMAGFYLVGGNAWARWLLCLLGFILARFFVNSLTRSSRPNPPDLPAEIRYAP